MLFQKGITDHWSLVRSTYTATQQINDHEIYRNERGSDGLMCKVGGMPNILVLQYFLLQYNTI